MFIINHITLKNAVIIEFEVADFEDNTFSMLVTGFEANNTKTLKTLYCLSPDTEEAPKTYYNSVFEKDDKDANLPYCWIDFAENKTYRANIKNVIVLQKHN